MNGILPLWSSSSKYTTPVQKEKHHKRQTEHYSTKCFSEVSSSSNKKKVWKTYNQQKPKEIWWLNEVWLPARTPGTDKGHCVKTKEVWIKCELFNN
jgi:hypothetical protein